MGITSTDLQAEERRVRRAATLSVGSNTFLVLTKLAVGMLTGSVGVLSEALHSLVDLGAAIMARYAVVRARAPADEHHPTGHGKIESLSGTVEGTLVLGAAALIVAVAVHRLIEGGELRESWLGLAVMGLSAVVNVFVSAHLFRVAKQSDSVALEADAVHLRADVWTSLGVFVGLAAIQITDLHILDPVIALAVAAIIAYEGWAISRRAVRQLLDTALPAEEVRQVRQLLAEHYGTIVGFHALRTSQAGPERHVDVHVVMCRKMPLGEAHEICDHLEGDLKELWPRTYVLIHAEPCPVDCDGITDEAELPAYCSRLREQIRQEQGR